ncbi:MAG: DegV family protein [Clostridia bacterium]|nr:DegV family protein [Clostridia bacterium]
MGNYQFTLSTDSTCDLYHAFIVENDIKHVSLTFTVEAKNGELDSRLDNFTEYEQYVDFYNELRAGAFSRTSMLNYEAHYRHFLKIAEEGAEDVVHFTISSGLSPTKDVAAKAAADVKKDYPKFNVYVVDPLTATVGQGALVRIALKCRNEGKSAQEAYDLCNSVRLHIQHYIVAGDLSYLKKGGRISSAKAMLGTMLNIKPILSFDKEGKLFPLTKVKGARKAISFIKEKLEHEAPDPAFNYVFIVHTDNEAPCEELANYVRERFGIEPFVSIMGPVIGSHVGPGAFALGYLTKSERNEF